MITSLPSATPQVARHAAESVLRSQPAAGDRIHRQVDEDGVCHLTFDAPSSSANVFDRETLREFERQVDWLQEAVASGQVRGVILRSAKERIFIAGADLKAMMAASAVAVGEMAEMGQRVFTAFKRLPVPKVAAIHGACLGGGFELALCADRRLASDASCTKIGLPETQLGLVPAWGGCTRLPRLIGVRAAARHILKGAQFGSVQAMRAGLVDEVVPVECLVSRARQIIQQGAAARRRLSRSALRSMLAAPLWWPLAVRRVRRDTRGNYPALFKALRLVCLSPWRTTEQSLAAERREFQRLVHRLETRNLIQLFFAREGARKRRPAGPTAEIQRVAVIGAGVMGSGIAYWLASRGLPVLLTDVDDKALAAASQRIKNSFAHAARRGIVTRCAARVGEDRITLARGPVPLRGADLVIEAATENRQLKKRIFEDLVRRCREDALLATNTSAIPVGSLLADPRLIGLHFFNPVHAMPLVEVVRPQGAAAASVATAVRFVQAIGKVPVVVADSPGFLVNRILMPYLLEAARLADDGTPVRVIDEAMRHFGMPMGPLRLLDEVGLDVAADVAATLREAFPHMPEAPAFITEWVRTGRLGRKSGLGFYRHGPKGETPAFERKEPALAPGGTRIGEPDEVARRLSLLLTNEAARCLEEGVAESAEAIDLAMVLGTGYAPFRGGPLRHADETGLRLISGQLHHLEHESGPVFRPAALLVSRSETGEFFHPPALPATRDAVS